MAMHRRYRKKRINLSKLILVILMLTVALFVVVNKNKKINVSLENLQAFRLSHNNLNNIKEISAKYNENFAELITYYCLENNFFDKKIDIDDKFEQNIIMNYDIIKNSYDKEEFNKYYSIINSLFAEIKTFPVDSDLSQYIYGDSWGAERTYGGNRIHQGCDIMDRENIRGRLRVVSMTDGIISNIGWNEKGGWRVGITSSSGNYYYYAHLDSYAEGIEEGKTVKSGDFIGLMGDSGYSKTEGTTGNFEVHLHIGICPKTEIINDELWINPYPFLRNVEISKD